MLIQPVCAFVKDKVFKDYAIMQKYYYRIVTPGNSCLGNFYYLPQGGYVFTHLFERLPKNYWIDSNKLVDVWVTGPGRTQ